MLLGDSGFVSRIAHALGWASTPADFPTLIFDAVGRGIVITHLALVTPLFLLLFERLASICACRRCCSKAAALGASRAQAWRRIGLPCCCARRSRCSRSMAWPCSAPTKLPLLIGAAQPSMVAVTIQRAVAGYDLAQRPLGYAMVSSVYLLMVIAGWAFPHAAPTRAAGDARMTRLKRACARLGLHAMTLVMLVPFAVLACCRWRAAGVIRTLWPSAWQFDQWRVFGDQGAALASAALHSTSLALVVAVTATVIGFFTSQAVAGHRHEQRWMALALLPYALPPVVFAIGIGQAWAALHLSGSTAGVVLAQLPFATAYAVLLCRGYWTPHTLALAELAMSLGAHGAGVVACPSAAGARYPRSVSVSNRAHVVVRFRPGAPGRRRPGRDPELQGLRIFQRGRSAPGFNGGTVAAGATGLALLCRPRPVVAGADRGPSP